MINIFSKGMVTLGISLSAVGATVASGLVGSHDTVEPELVTEYKYAQYSYGVASGDVKARTGAAVDNDGAMTIDLGGDEPVVYIDSSGTSDDTEVYDEIEGHYVTDVDYGGDDVTEPESSADYDVPTDSDEDTVDIVSDIVNRNMTRSSDDDSPDGDEVDVGQVIDSGILSIDDINKRIENVTLSDPELASLKSLHPTGSRWADDDYYRWNAGVYRGGYGCAGFAYMLSDAVYGSYLPAQKINGNGDVQQYDCIELYDNAHTAFVLSVNDNGTVTVAEGNVNDSVIWGSTYNISDISAVLRRA